MDGVIDLSSLSLPHQNYQVNIINIFSSFYFIFPRKIIEIVKSISVERDIFLRVFSLTLLETYRRNNLPESYIQ